MPKVQKGRKNSIPASRELGGRLRKLRRHTGLLQSQAAEQADISTSHYTHIESGKSAFSPRVLRRLCEAFGARKEWVLDGEGPPYVVSGRNVAATPARAAPRNAADTDTAVVAESAIAETYQLMSAPDSRRRLAEMAESCGLSEYEVLRGLVLAKLQKIT